MLDSKKKAAIKALKGQKLLLDESHQDESWIAETSDMLRKYLGEKSELYLKCNLLTLGLYNMLEPQRNRQ